MAGSLRYAPDTCSAPGECLEELLAERGMSAEQLAAACSMEVHQVVDLLAGKLALTRELASRLEKLGLAGADFWLRYEARFHAYQLRGQEVRALTLHQPWATLVATGHKMVETRSWRTHYHGPLLIHSSRTYPRSGRELLVELIPYGPLFDRAPWDEKCPLGTLIALTHLVDCVPTEALAKQSGGPVELMEWYRTEEGGPVIIGELEAQLGNYGAERWAWLLDRVHVFSEPIPGKGSRGLWRCKIPPEVCFV